MCRLKVKYMQQELETLLDKNLNKRYSFLSNNCFYCILDPLVESGLYQNKGYKKLFKLCNFNKSDEIYKIMCEEFEEIEQPDFNMCLVLTKMDSIYYNHLVLILNNFAYEITQREKVFNKKLINYIINNKCNKFFKI